MSILITKPNLHRLPLIFLKSLIRCSTVTLSKNLLYRSHFCNNLPRRYTRSLYKLFFPPRRNKYLRISDLPFCIWKWFFDICTNCHFDSWPNRFCLIMLHLRWTVFHFCVQWRSTGRYDFFVLLLLCQQLFFSSGICYHVMKAWGGRTSIWMRLFSSTSCVRIRVLNV